MPCITLMGMATVMLSYVWPRIYKIYIATLHPTIHDADSFSGLVHSPTHCWIQGSQQISQIGSCQTNRGGMFIYSFSARANPNSWYYGHNCSTHSRTCLRTMCYPCRLQVPCTSQKSKLGSLKSLVSFCHKIHPMSSSISITWSPTLCRSKDYISPSSRCSQTASPRVSLP